MNRFVMDVSITMAWCFEDEKAAYTESLLDAVAAGTIAIVPTIWAYEVLNVLVVAQRKKRMTQAKALQFWRELQTLPIAVDDKIISHSSLGIMSLANQYNLNAYDAAYLELALRESLALATLDNDLKKAALALGLSLARSKD